MPPNRAAGRDVFFFDLRNPEEVLGGLVLTDGITNRNFYSMLEILLVHEDPWLLHNENKLLVEKDDHPLQPGKYYITGERISSFPATDT